MTDATARAARLRLVCFDVDGTLTDGRLLYDADGVESKAFHVQDGLGLKLLQSQGIAVALVTARQSPIVARRGAELGLAHVLQGCRDKRAALFELCAGLGLAPAQAGFMGDDLPDLPAMLECGLAAAPRDATPPVLARAHWRSERRGGRGAAREFCDFVLAAQGRLDAALSAFLDR
jgi:3-deoxy-D-manno-octulosonate 8-phosphate phosphatase (KDO 8-P phosphatase)